MDIITGLKYKDGNNVNYTNGYLDGGNMFGSRIYEGKSALSRQTKTIDISGVSGVGHVWIYNHSHSFSDHAMTTNVYNLYLTN